jgi:transcriptional regulator with GAF, ATPase, and Fis domain
MADGGTLFLDEVGEMSPRMQALLLRVLETGEIQRVGSERLPVSVDVRVISATNRDLMQYTREKGFREDLYYRLNVVCLAIPPLRERGEDIRLLFDHYLSTMSERFGLPLCRVTDEAYEYIEAYQWPGNIRELRNLSERVSQQHPGTTLTVDILMRAMSNNWGPGTPPPAAVAMTNPDMAAHVYYERMVNGQESFWTVIYEPFMLRDLTRDTVRGVVRRGLKQTRGSYRLLARLFNMPGPDYKRFLNFLQKYDCHLPFHPFRQVQDDRQMRVS